MSKEWESDEAFAKQEQQKDCKEGHMDRREALQRLRDVAIITPVTYVLMRPSSTAVAGSAGPPPNPPDPGGNPFN